LQSRFQPCSGWLRTTAARSRASLVASGHGVRCWHIVRELIDGASGLRADNDNLPPGVDAAWWAGYRDRLETAARQAAGG